VCADRSDGEYFLATACQQHALVADMAGEHAAICEPTDRDANAEVQMIGVICIGAHERPPIVRSPMRACGSRQQADVLTLKNSQPSSLAQGAGSDDLFSFVDMIFPVTLQAIRRDMQRASGRANRRLQHLTDSRSVNSPKPNVFGIYLTNEFD
jgi:hypothetical protein